MAISSALVVDDSKSARYSLRKMLEKMDVAVAFAESGEQAIESLGDSQPDVIFMDHMMPGMDGLETTQVIKNNPNWSKIPVVMCTSKDGDEYTKEAKSHGAVAILPKPASLKQLSEMLDSLEQLVSLMPETVTAEPAPAPVSAEVSLSVAQIEEMVQKAVQAAVTEAVQASVTSVVQAQLTDHISRMKTDLLSSTLEKAETTSRQLVEQQVAGVQGQLNEDVQRAIGEAQTATQGQMTDQITQIANTEAKTCFNSLSQQLLTPINDQLAQLQSKLDTAAKLTPEQVQAVKQIVEQQVTQETSKVSAELASKAEQMAKEKATQVAQQLLDTRSTTQQAQQEQLAEQIKENNQSLLGRLHLLFGFAVGIGIASAAIVFAIK